jgi:threonine/homoserine/homoserine lactone efflux protein
MTTQTILAFTLATFIFALIPGPGVMAVTAKSIASGFREGVILAIGLILGDLVYLLFALLGLSAIAQPMGEFFVILRYCGAAYLIYLGVRMWIDSRNLRKSEVPESIQHISFKAFRGMFISLGNPKVIVFYLGFLPVFFDLSRVSVLSGIIIVSIVVTVSIIVLGVYAYLASRGERFYNAKKHMIFTRGAGALMILAGMKVVRE